ncbi:MAG: TRAP transporter large permease subunit [Treponema sp.]|nr:TRAP transporter large permease subunit [Treponema sp.]MCL2252047.1 TRAP transporter large permease subunit [Treponema sp.]
METDDKNPAGFYQNKIKPLFYLIEDYFCIAVIILMALFPLLELFAYFIFKTGIAASSGLIVHCLLFSALICGMICTRKESHLAISIVQYLPEGKIRERLNVFCNLVSAFVSVVIALSSISFIKVGLDESLIGFIPRRLLASIIPVAFFIIAVRFARRTNLKGWKIIIPVLTLLLGIAASFPSIAKIIWGFEMPDAVFYLCEFFIDLAWYMKVPLVVFLILAALGGTPLFVVLGGLSLLLLQASGGEQDSVAVNIYFGLINPNIIAIPLFTLVGFFLSESKAGERLVNTFRSFFSWLPGGIIIVSVIICAFFTSFTGASGVTILALGGILFAILSEHLKYPPKFSIGLLTSVGSIGLLFPPSLPLILVGTVMQVNILHLFLGGIIPGILLVVAMIVFGIIISIKVKIPVEKFELKKALVSLKESSLEILLPIFLIVAYFSGILDLMQLGAAAVLYIFIVEVVIHRDIKIKDIKKIFDKAIPIIGGVIIILALARAFSYYIVDTQAPANVAAWMHEVISSKWVFLLLLNAALLVIGFVLDMFSAILVVLPLIIPLGEIYGIDPVHLGIIFLVNLEVGYITPPVGLNLFLSSYRFQKPFVEICRYVSPFLLVRLVVVLFVTYLPWLSTWLVKVFTG